MVSVEQFTKRRPYNAASEFVDANVNRGLGSKIAFADGKRTLTYQQLQDNSVRFAHGLEALGVRQESRIALLMLDMVDYPVAFWGSLRAGVVCIPLNTLLTTEQYYYMLEDSRAEAIFVSAPLAKAIIPDPRQAYATASDRALRRDRRGPQGFRSTATSTYSRT